MYWAAMITPSKTNANTNNGGHHVAIMEEGRSAFKILTGKPTEKIHLYGIGVDRSIILERILKKWISMRIWVDSAQDRDYWRPLMNAALNLRFL